MDIPQDLYLKGLLGVYELNDISLLRDVFVLAYQRSAQEYLTLEQSLVEPDPIRMRNRIELHDIVHLIVKGLYIHPREFIEQYTSEHVRSDDQDFFKLLVIKELHELHEGVLARYRLKINEFEQWKALDPQISSLL